MAINQGHDPVSRDQKNTRRNPCPICGGGDNDKRGRGERCSGYVSRDGEYAYCTREELAGTLQPHGNTSPPAYAHRMHGPCRCGVEHGPARPTFANHAAPLRRANTAPAHAPMRAPTSQPRPQPQRVPDNVSQIETYHVYRDEAGRELYRVVRRGTGKDKAIYVQHPNGKGGWESGRGDAPTILYRSDEIAKADKGQPVYVVEGEKCADALIERGLLATTNIHGAGSWGLAGNAAKLLKRRHVYILPDNDAPGRAHAEEITASLAKVAASVTVLDLPGLPEKGDVYDWLKVPGNGVPALTELMEATAPLHVNKPRYQILTDIEMEEMPPAKGILGDLLYEKSLAFLYGPPGRWKSFVALSWALSIATGTPWFGREVIAGDVLYIAAEGALGLGKRIRAWKRRNGFASQQTRLHGIGVPVQLLHAESIPDLLEVIRETDIEPALVVIDTLGRSMDGGDESAAKDANLAITAASIIKQELGCCVLLVHHPGKDAARGMRGSSAWFGGADTVIAIAGTEDDKKKRLDIGDTIILTSEKPKDDKPFTDIYLTSDLESWSTDDGQVISSLVLMPTDAPSFAPKSPKSGKLIAADKLLDVLRAFGGNGAPNGELKREFYERWGMSSSAFDKALKDLYQEGRAECVMGRWRAVQEENA